jgi:hypothetical protein
MHWNLESYGWNKLIGRTYEYFNEIKEKNIKDKLEKRDRLTYEAKIPKEFIKYIQFNKDDKMYMKIPYLEYIIYVYYWKNRVVFDYHYSAEYSFEEIIKKSNW